MKKPSIATKVLIGTSFIVLACFFLFQSCGNKDMSQQIRKVDSLKDKVKEAENTMVIDISTIKSRYDTIQRMDSFIKRNYNREVTDRFSSIMNQYSAIKSNYRNFIKNYKLVKYENEKHSKRLNDLKKDLIEGNITQKKFKSIYQEEKKIINDHLKRVKNLVASITRIEQQYRRTQDKVAKRYRMIKRDNP